MAAEALSATGAEAEPPAAAGTPAVPVAVTDPASEAAFKLAA